MPSKLPSYVLVTPARNEAQFIELTIKSVVAQTVWPVKWVIVSDGSTDGTDDIVSRYASAYPWIELVRMPERRERHFAGKSIACRSGWSRMGNLKYEVIGNVDADISFDEDHFEFLIGKFAENPKLGVAGTLYREGNEHGQPHFVNREHVSGMCQLFRRECFEAIGGYPEIKSGGIDLIALFSARAKGWQTRTFTEKVFLHHRKMSVALHAGLRERLYRGRMDYLLGSHPVWEIFRSVYQMTRRPYLIGGMLILANYFWHGIRSVERTMPEELIQLRRREQMSRLKDVFRCAVHGNFGARAERDSTPPAGYSG